MEKERKTKESVLKAVNKYNQNSINFAISYKKPEHKEGERLKAYLEQTGQSANSYIKGLIKADLDIKGIPYTKKEFVINHGGEKYVVIAETKKGHDKSGT